MLSGQNYKSNQFSLRIDEVTSLIKETESKFKNLDKSLKKQFPATSRNSPIYLSMEIQYGEFGEIIDRINTAGPLFKKNGRAYEKLFGGPFKRMDQITSEDEEFPEVKQLANKIESIITSVSEDLSHVGALENFLIESLRRSEEVFELNKELKKEISSFSRDVERSRKIVNSTESRFNDASGWLRNYPVFNEGEAIRKDLRSRYESYSNNQTELQNMVKQMNYFLSGSANEGEEQTVWELFDQLNDKKIQIISKMVSFPDILVDQVEKLELFTQVLIDFKKEVENSENDFKKNLLSVNREVTDNRQENGEIINQLKEIKLTIDLYPIILKADSVEASLSIMQENYEEMEDSLTVTMKKFERFLSGTLISEEEITARSLYEITLNQGNQQLVDLKAQPNKLSMQRKKLKDLNNLIIQFSEVLNEMEENISILNKSIRDEEEGLIDDSLRYISLNERIPEDLNKNSFPYHELGKSFSDIEIKLIEAREVLNDLKISREKFISHVGKMDGIKTDPSQYERFNELQKDFSELKKIGERRIKELDDTIKVFRQVIIDNYLNTPEFWALKYTVEEESSRRGGQIIKENFGYLLDMNRFRAEKYHGHLISDFELKLIKRGNDNPIFELVFSGKNEFIIEGIQVLNGKGELFFESLRDNVKSKTEDKIVNFEWIIDVNENVISQISNETEHTLRILYVTVSSRVNLTGYTTRIYKEYRIPKVRLKSWRRIIGSFQENIS